MYDLAKTSWSWGRMFSILSEGREIEPCHQLEQIYKSNELETKQEPPPANHH